METLEKNKIALLLKSDELLLETNNTGMKRGLLSYKKDR